MADTLAGAPPPGSTGDPLVGRRVGSYQVMERLGEGGMGAVYRGMQPEIGKRVAIKFLATEFSSVPEIVSRFFDEAKAVNVIGHENIVDIFDFGRTPDGRSYFVMELLEGPPLDQLLGTDRALSPSRAVDVSRQIASALAAAHAMGIIHRDLKPENAFLVRRAGRADFVKLCDFGIAKLQTKESTGDATLRRTKTGIILGTPGYMAPEQASGDSVDARADVYALGVLIYRMLAGEIPFPGPTFTEILRRQLMEPPKRLDARRSDVAKPLADLVQRMLESSPEKRPQTMREVEEVLQTLMTGQLGRDVRWKDPPLRAPSLIDEAQARTELREGPPPPRPKPPVLALAGGATALIAAAVIALVLARRGADRPAANPTPPPATLVAPPKPIPTTPPPTTIEKPPERPVDRSGSFTLHVDSVPAGAEISDGVRVLGVTPAEVKLDAAGPLFLRLAGYREERIDAHRDDGRVRMPLHKLPQKAPKRGIGLDD